MSTQDWHGNRVYWTRVLGLIPPILFTLFWPCGYITRVNQTQFLLMEINSTGLDFHEWSPSLHMSHVGPSCDLFSPLPVSLSLFSSYILSSTHTLISLTYNFPQLSHNTHLNNTLSQVMFLQYWEYFLLVNIVVICQVFFFKEKIRTYQEFFFFVSVNIVINLFVSIL